MLSATQTRDARLLALLEKHRYMTTHQAAALLFDKTIKSKVQSQKKASERLKTLYKIGLIPARYRIPQQPYIYAAKKGEYNHLVQHYLTIVDVWIELVNARPSGVTLYSEVEMQFDDVRTDLYVEYINSFTNDKRQYFIEIERNNSANLQEKVGRYYGLFLGRHNPGDRLVFVCNQRRTLGQIERYQNEFKDIKMQAVMLGNTKGIY
jgi:hypothetical protein